MNSILILFLSAILFNNKNRVYGYICTYYPYFGNIAFNASCSSSCCNNFAPNAEAACCSPIQWNAGVYIGLTIPLFCCIASILVGFSYCCLILKPSSTADSARRHLTSLRSTSVSPSSGPTATTTAITTPSKDDPPTYNEIFKNKLNSKETPNIAPTTTNDTSSLNSNRNTDLNETDSTNRLSVDFNTNQIQTIEITNELQPNTNTTNALNRSLLNSSSILTSNDSKSNNNNTQEYRNDSPSPPPYQILPNIINKNDFA